MTRRIARRVAAGAIVMCSAWLHAVTAAAQPLPFGPSMPSCEAPKTGQACVLAIDRHRPQSLGELKVWNSSSVVVRVLNKSPFEACWSEAQRGSVITGHEADPLDDLLARLGTVQVLLDGASRGPTPEAERDRIAIVGRAVTLAIREGTHARDLIQTDFTTFPALTAAVFRAANVQAGRTEAARTDFPQAIAARRTVLVATVAEIEAALDRIKDDAPGSLLARVHDELRVARDEFSGVAYYLSTLDPPEFDASITLVGGRNETIRDVVACGSRRTMQAAVRVPVTVTYGNVRGTSVSAGLLLSSLARRDIRVGAVSDATSPRGIRYRIVDDRRVPQLMPALLLNVEMGSIHYRREGYQIEISAGVGINSGDPDIGVSFEFFLGPTVRFGNLGLTPGLHVGRQAELDGGFRLNDTVPSDFSVPLVHGWARAIGVTLSYRLPMF